MFWVFLTLRKHPVVNAALASAGIGAERSHMPILFSEPGVPARLHLPQSPLLLEGGGRVSPDILAVVHHGR